VCGRLAELRQAITRYATRFDANALTLGEARAFVADCNAIEASVAALRALAAVRVAEAGTWRGSGYRSAAEELAAASGTSTGAARHTLDTGRRLASNQKVAQAALAGELSPAQASLVANGAEAAPDKTDDLLEKAKSSSLSELADEVARTKAAAPDAEERRAAAHARRRLRTWTDPEGVWHLFAEGLPDDGARLHTVIGDIRRALIAARRERGITGETFQALDYDSLLTLVRLALGTEAELSLADLYRQGLFPGLDDLLYDGDPPPAGAQSAAQGPRAAGPIPHDGSAATDESPPPAVATAPDEPRGDPPAGVPATSSDVDSTGQRASTSGPVSAASPTNLPFGESPWAAASTGEPGHPTYSEETANSPAGPCESSAPGHPSQSTSPAGTEDAAPPMTRPADDPNSSRAHPAGGGNRQPRRRRSRPISAQIQVRVDLDTLLRGAVAEGELCEIAGYGPVPVSVVEDLVANDATFIVAILTRAKRVVGVAHFGRAPNAYQDSALSFVYPKCAAAGCNNRAFLQRDHRRDWAETHVTVFDWMDRLCTHHHRLKTTQGWALVAGRGKRAFVPPTDPRHPRHRPPGHPSNGSEGGGAASSPLWADTG
jgi:hypothetical protein